jgi:hypothetical protein
LLLLIMLARDRNCLNGATCLLTSCCIGEPQFSLSLSLLIMLARNRDCLNGATCLLTSCCIGELQLVVGIVQSELRHHFGECN